jgi:hypothetical protein
MTRSESLSVIFRTRNWQRNPRKGLCQPTALCHRFSIKGGLTFGEALMLNNRNKLLDLTRMDTPKA